MCLDQSIGMKKKADRGFGEPIEAQREAREMGQGYERPLKVGDVYGVTHEVGTTLEQAQNSLEDMQQGVDNLREMVEKLNEEI